MNLLSKTQCFNLALAAGFDKANAEIAAAVALAETLTFQSGRQFADFAKVGDTSLVTATWGPSYGGWQIRSLVADYETGRIRDASKLPDPAFNAASAYAIFRAAGRSWQPWSTFTSGVYLGYMQDAIYNPRPTIPAGTYLVTGGDSLSKIGTTTGYPWRLLAAINGLRSPYLIFPGQVLLLPDWPYTVQSGDTLSKIAATYAEVTWQRIAEFNELANPDRLSVGQVLRIPRYTAWDGVTLIL